MQETRPETQKERKQETEQKVQEETRPETQEEKKQEIEKDTGGDNGRKEAEAVFKINLKPGMVFQKVIRTTTYPDGRVVVEEKQEVKRCDCCSK